MSKKVLVSLVLWVFCAAAAMAYDSSACRVLIVPEAIWAPATGGGVWTTSLQITSLTDNAMVFISFIHGGGSWRGPFVIANDLDRLKSVSFDNILAAMATLDPTFDYSGRVGALLVFTQDTDFKIHAAARTVNGHYGKTFQGLADVDGNCSTTGRNMMIQNMTGNATYRSFVGFYNHSAQPITFNFRLVSSTGALIGDMFSKTFAGWDFKAFDPFAAAGVPYPGHSHVNAVLEILPESGTGRLFGFGSSANNNTNDTSAHLMVHWE